MYTLDKTFAANGQTWATDAETLALLAQYADEQNAYMLGVVFTVGRDFGRIQPRPVDPAAVLAVLGPGWYAEYAGENDGSIRAGVRDNRDAWRVDGQIRYGAGALRAAGFLVAFTTHHGQAYQLTIWQPA